MSGKLVVVVGGQYGSEAKGAVVAHLARTERARPRAVMRVGGPNAGHTVYDDNGQRWALRQVPAGVVVPGAALLIAAGSEVDPEVLEQEVQALESAGHVVSPRLFIDAQATLLSPLHRSQGAEQVRRGSTGKGVGVARADRIRRRAPIWAERSGGWKTAANARDVLRGGGVVIVEGTQGYGLGLHAGHYPYTTSGDCTAIDTLAQAQLSPWASYVDNLEVWVVLRTHPIRVADRNGSSGWMRNEISWEALAARTGGYVQPERTTVTQRIRRVGEWDPELAAEAITANGGADYGRPGPGVVRVALTMFDYWAPELANALELTPAAEAEVDKLQVELGVPIELVGTGPATTVDRRKHG
jgi:adenylosuccinate synthase